MNCLMQSLGEDVLNAYLSSMPDAVSILSACTGSGAFELAAQAVFRQFERVSHRSFQETSPNDSNRFVSGVFTAQSSFIPMQA